MELTNFICYQSYTGITCSPRFLVARSGKYKRSLYAIIRLRLSQEWVKIFSAQIEHHSRLDVWKIFDSLRLHCNKKPLPTLVCWQISRCTENGHKCLILSIFPNFSPCLAIYLIFNLQPNNFVWLGDMMISAYSRWIEPAMPDKTNRHQF